MKYLINLSVTYPNFIDDHYYFVVSLISELDLNCSPEIDEIIEIQGFKCKIVDFYEDVESIYLFEMIDEKHIHFEIMKVEKINNIDYKKIDSYLPNDIDKLEIEARKWLWGQYKILKKNIPDCWFDYGSFNPLECSLSEIYADEIEKIKDKYDVKDSLNTKLIENEIRRYTDMASVDQKVDIYRNIFV